MIRFAVILLASFLTYTNIGNDPLLDSLFIAVGLWAVYENRQHVNIYSLIIIIILMRALEVLLMHWLGGNRPMVFYPTYIFIDVTTVLLIIFKIPLLSYWENFRHGSFDAKQYCITRADFLLVGIYGVYLFVTMISFIEHWYRHIEDLPVLVNLFEYLFQFESIKGHYAQYGIYDVHSLTEYFFFNARHVYDAAPTFKAYFNILEHASILATSYKFMQSNHIVKA